ncbi:hypothetical protein CDAR_458701 [Caerostris darwini]|uniref:Uncharacterized protein n=1 Tax=Caerostris darwini TaxID=1538125 RepID=A0AAV4WVN1_9ARAC|nr:hypothetical protein CDAR_458701 [Caerostris darwini]
MGWEQRNHLRWGSNKMRNPEFREYREKVNPWDLVSLTAHRDQRDARLGLAQKHHRLLANLRVAKKKSVACSTRDFVENVANIKKSIN